ncbi:integrin alpha-9-like, partial [Salvelinus sp. IW2-2015]|uniref:integrin alpha-9-like n=1 Tax=Salvelinus sp. IW2-2015 TaxID=2691554 RepID=UPI0038D513AB
MKGSEDDEVIAWWFSNYGGSGRAPKANSSYSSSLHTPGAVFKCRVHSNPERRCTEMNLGRGNKPRESCGKTCQGDRDDEWMGVSLARQDKPNGKILACAHRWKNVYYDSELILPHGYCSIIPPTLQGRTQALIPCYEEREKSAALIGCSCIADITIGAFMADSVVLLRSRPVITVDVSIYLPVSINISVPQCHEGPQHLNCFNATVCLLFRGKHLPGQIELLYNLTADVDKRQRSQSSRVYFIQNGAQISLMSNELSLDINREDCQQYTAYVKKDVKDIFTAITFEVAYTLGKHVVNGHLDKDLPALTPVLRWRKGDKMAAKNETWFERNCLSDDCAADLRLHGKLLLSGLHVRSHLALGGVRNVSLNVTLSNAGDDAYDTNIYFNFSRDVFYINYWQK